MGLWGAIKKAINDNLEYPLNRQNRIYRNITVMQSASVTIPQTGWYWITVVGAGGSGGRAYYRATSNSQNSAPSGGGGGGGIAKSRLFLEIDTVIPVTVAGPVSSFGSYLSSASGGNAVDATSGPVAGVAGEGGIAVGGNIINMAGNSGKIGISVDSHVWEGGAGGSTQPTNFSGRKADGSLGGSGYFLENVPSVYPTAGSRNNGPGIYGGGNGGSPSGNSYGGAGGAAYGGGGEGGGAQHTSSTSAHGGGYGGQGGSGAVIIEYFEEVFG